MNNADQSQQPSRRNLLIGLGAAVGLVLFITILAFVVFGATNRGSSSNTSNSTTVNPTVTKQDVSKDIDSASSKMKQASTDITSAKSVLKDNEKQVKVGS